MGHNASGEPAEVAFSSLQELIMSPVKLKPLVDEVAREAVRRARQISFDAEFRPTRQYAQQFGIDLIRHDCCHYSARWERFILNIFPSNLRLVSDPHRPKTPRLLLPDEWGLRDVVIAIVQSMAGVPQVLLDLKSEHRIAAAAPQLLDALRASLEFMQMQVGQRGANPPIEQARAAIAAATGE